MTQALAKPEELLPPAKPIDPAILHEVIIGGDLSKLTKAQQLEYYNAVCAAAGVNPATRPFAFIKLNNRLTLYALKDCTEQLRVRHGVSVTEMQGKMHGDVYVVTAKGQNGQGRIDMATGAVSIKGLSGDVLANALMKAETKAKRRLTLSVCGLGVLDETELETIPDAQPPSTEAEKAEPQAPAPATSDSPQNDDRQKPEATSGKPEDRTGKDTAEEKKMRQEIAEALRKATEGWSNRNKQLWLKHLTAFGDFGGYPTLGQVPGLRKGKKTSALAILHTKIKKGTLDSAAAADWLDKQNANAERAAQDAAAEAPQPTPADLLPPEGDEEDDTIPFERGPAKPGADGPVFTPALGRRRPADWDRE